MLLNDTDLKKVLPITRSFSHSNLVADIRHIENREVRKTLLGPTLYDSLNTKYNNAPETLTDPEKALLEYVQPVVANLAVWLYLDKGNVIIDDNGISAVHGDDRKPAFEWQVVRLQKSLKTTGFNAIDDLIDFLEDNVGDYPTWASSVANDKARAFFINSARDFHYYVDIQESRWIYLSVLPIMRRVEKQHIMATLCKELFDEIKSQIENNNVSANNEMLMDGLKGAAAHLTWSKALNELAVTIDDAGIHLLNNTFSGTVRAMTPAEVNRVQVISDEHLKIGMGCLEGIKNHLQLKADDYPLYKNSECYIDLSKDETGEFENDADSGIMML